MKRSQLCGNTGCNFGPGLFCAYIFNVIRKIFKLHLASQSNKILFLLRLHRPHQCNMQRTRHFCTFLHQMAPWQTLSQMASGARLVPRVRPLANFLLVECETHLALPIALLALVQLVLILFFSYTLFFCQCCHTKHFHVISIVICMTGSHDGRDTRPRQKV